MNKQNDLTNIAGLVDAYENAIDAKAKYKAESQICRLVARHSSTAMIYGKQGMYIASVENDGEYRTPHLQKVLSQDDLVSIARKQNAKSPKSAFHVKSIEFVPGLNLMDDYTGRLVGVAPEAKR